MTFVKWKVCYQMTSTSRLESCESESESVSLDSRGRIPTLSSRVRAVSHSHSRVFTLADETALVSPARAPQEEKPPTQLAATGALAPVLALVCLAAHRPQPELVRLAV